MGERGKGKKTKTRVLKGPKLQKQTEIEKRGAGELVLEGSSPVREWAFVLFFCWGSDCALGVAGGCSAARAMGTWDCWSSARLKD